MPWPTVPVVTTGMDADADALPRDAILDLAQKFNQLIAMRGVASGVCDLGPDGIVPAARMPPGFPAGTAMLFAQTTAPTGWTKSTTHNNKALRVVNGTAGSGGSVDFTTAFASQAVSGGIGATTAGGVVYGTTLALSQIPSHTHSYNAATHTYSALAPGTEVFLSQASAASNTGAAGSGGSHDHGFGGYSHGHSFTGTAINLTVQYVDVIIATKD